MSEQTGQEPTQDNNEGSGNEGQAPEGQGQQNNNQGQQGQDARQGSQSPQQGSQGQQAGLQGMTPEQLQAEVVRLRNESANYRTKSNGFEQQATKFQQDFEQMKNGFAQALGLGGDDKQDPAQLQNQLQQTQGQFRRERLQNVVLMDSLSQGADPGLTWAHLFASGDLDNVDINASDFREQVSQRVLAAMESTPKLKADYASPQKNVGGGSNPANGHDEPLPDVNPWKKETFNLTKQAQILRDKPDLARRLQNAARA